MHYHHDDRMPKFTAVTDIQNFTTDTYSQNFTTCRHDGGFWQDDFLENSPWGFPSLLSNVPMVAAKRGALIKEKKISLGFPVFIE